jgi:hypothetical protein
VQQRRASICLAALGRAGEASPSGPAPGTIAQIAVKFIAVKDDGGFLRMSWTNYAEARAPAFRATFVSWTQADDAYDHVLN